MDYLEQYHYDKGYKTWPYHDPQFPDPILGDIQVESGSEILASVSCKVRFPNAIPPGRNIAIRSAGIQRSWSFAVAIATNRDAGLMRSQLICIARHLRWFEEHNETDIADEQIFEISPANLVVGRSESSTKDILHGPVHFDRVTCSYMLLATGEVLVQMIGIHQTWGTIGVPDAPRITPPGGSSPPTEVIPPEGSEPGPHIPHGDPRHEEKPKPHGVTTKSTGRKRGRAKS